LESFRPPVFQFLRGSSQTHCGYDRSRICLRNWVVQLEAIMKEMRVTGDLPLIGRSFVNHCDLHRRGLRPRCRPWSPPKTLERRAQTEHGTSVTRACTSLCRKSKRPKPSERSSSATDENVWMEKMGSRNKQICILPVLRCLRSSWHLSAPSQLFPSFAVELGLSRARSSQVRYSPDTLSLCFNHLIFGDNRILPGICLSQRVTIYGHDLGRSCLPKSANATKGLIRWNLTE
jgi:hypothetical protein